MGHSSFDGKKDLADLLKLIAVVACTPAGVIGRDGAMPWKLSSDLRRFKALTMGGTLIMGRKTYDSIGKPLPGRETIVLTRSAFSTSCVPTLHMAPDKRHAVSIAQSFSRPTFVVGGAEIYKLFWEECEEIWLTRVNSEADGDTRIDIPLENFDLLESTQCPQSAQDSDATEFQRWRRKNSVPNF